MAARSLSRRLSEAPPYSYRSDPTVPSFADDKALVVFDGVCVLCSGFVRFILKRDRSHAFRLTTAQSPLGQALFRHYGLDTETFETNLVLADGLACAKLDTVALVGERRAGVARFPCCACCRTRSRTGSMTASPATDMPCSAAPSAA
jgi:hypothetical protein